MRKTVIVVSILVLIVLLILAITNPSNEDFQEFYRFEYSQNPSTRKSGNYAFFSVFEAKEERAPQADDFLKSLDETKIPPPQEKPTETYIGLLGKFYLWN